MATKIRRRSDRVKQPPLSDGDGPIETRHVDKELDKILAKMFEAKDEATIWESQRLEFKEQLHDSMVGKKMKQPYFFDHEGHTYEIKIEHKDPVSIKKVKSQNDE